MLFIGGAVARLTKAVRDFKSRVTGSRFGYDAADQAGNGKRHAPSRDLRSEDKVLNANKRTAVQSSARDACRNFTVASWMTRSHVNYVTRHYFQADAARSLSEADAKRLETDEEFKATIDAFDEQLEALVSELSKAENCDVSGRFCLSELVAMTERAAFIDGDLLWVKLASGHIQAVESDRLRDGNPDSVETVNGVQVDEAAGGRTVKYAIHSRGKGVNGFTFERWVSAANAWLHGYFDRFDQVRGVSPLAAALNSLRDLYEGVDFNLLKLKAEAMFGLKITRSATTAPGTMLPPANGEEETDSERQGYSIDMGKPTIFLDMDRGDDAEFMQSNSPGAQSQEFLKMVIAIVMKAADMPYSFYDESFTNFYGSRAAWLRYMDACVPKQERVQRLLNAWALWRLTMAVIDGRLVVPKEVNLTAACWDWIPEGQTWWDPVKDVEGDKSAVMAGFADPEDIARRRRGGNIWKNFKKIGRLIAFAKECGFVPSWAPIPQAAPDPSEAEKTAKPGAKELSA